MKVMNVFITGGTGYIGTATIAALNHAGHRVEALVRTDRDIAGATTVRGALEDLEVLRAASARAAAACRTSRSASVPRTVVAPSTVRSVRTSASTV